MNNDNTIKTLTGFLQTAEKNRKYPANTVYGIKAAFRLFAQELTDEEKESINTFNNHFEQIYQSVFNKNKAVIAASSLETYKRRMQGLIKDFEKYGVDPSKMATWDRPIRKNPSKKNILKKDNQEKKDPVTFPEELDLDKNIPMHRLELSLRPNVKAIILVPSDLTKEEGDKIKGIVEYLSVTVKNI